MDIIRGSARWRRCSSLQFSGVCTCLRSFRTLTTVSHGSNCDVEALAYNDSAKFLNLLASGPHINRLISPRIAAGLMGRSIYAPFWVAVAVNGLSFILIGAISYPERTQDATGTEENQYSPVVSEPQDPLIDTANPAIVLSDSPQSSMDDPVYKVWRATRGKTLLRSILRTFTLLKHPAARFCFVSYVLKRVAFASEGFMFQYASEKFLWPLHKTTWLRVAQASGAISATLLICPFVASILSRRAIPTHVINLGMVRSALLILACSFFSCWGSPSGIVFSLGTKSPRPYLIVNGSDEENSYGGMWIRRRT
jgi:hypothetical protein